MEPEELAAALSGLLAWAHEQAPKPVPEIRRRLREHLGTEPAELEVLSEDLSQYDHVNLQVALDAYAAEHGAAELIGLSLERGYRVTLAELAGGGAGHYGVLFEPGPPEYVPVDVGDRTISCLSSGLLLHRVDGVALAALLAPRDDDMGMGGGLRVQAMSTDRAVAERWLAGLRELMREHNAYRGKVLVFGGEHPFRPGPVSVRSLPDVRRDRIVLPEEALERIERHTAGLARHRDALRAAGRHVRRGLLLHGPPGTGKTLTIMYLATLMPERTVILLTGRALGAVGAACGLARSLEPAMVVIEDVDLIAEERGRHETTPLLFELLNAMDGLDEDADLIFALTTNRPETLEPALASRPGRIDLAVELPLPDAAARARLLELYAEGLDHTVGGWDAVVAATDGVSPAFIRELLRSAALAAAEAGRPVDETLTLAAVSELTRDRGALSASLVGAGVPESKRAAEGTSTAAG